MARWFCLFLLWGGIPAWATPSSNPHLLRAMEQVRALEEAEARVELDKAQKWPTNTVRDLALIEMWRGLAAAGLSEQTQAETSFEAAWRLDSTLELPATASPRVRDWWEAARKRVSPPPPSATLPVAALPRVEVAPRPVPAVTPWRRRMGTGLLVAGVLSLGAAALTSHLAQENHVRATEEPAVGRALDTQARAEAQVTGARILWGAGAAAALAGGVLWTFEWL